MIAKHDTTGSEVGPEGDRRGAPAPRPLVGGPGAEGPSSGVLEGVLGDGGVDGVQCSVEGRLAELPPYANRGVETYKTLTNIVHTLGNTLNGVSVDWLTLTVGPEGAEFIRGQSELEEVGYPQKGFAASEKRSFLGGTFWSRSKPKQPSKAHGMDYESLECSGGESGSPTFAALCRGLDDAKPSRVDIAFDLATGITADQFAQVVSPHAQSASLVEGVSGQNGINTRYIGGTESERRLRVYRKDLQSDSFRLVHGSTLRVELVLKGRQAAAWWEVWKQDKGQAYRVAAAHVLAMTGVKLDQTADIPEVEPVEGLDEAGKLAHFVKSHGPYIATLEAAGVDVLGLSRARFEGLTGSMARRWNARKGRIVDIGGSVLVKIARALLFS